jgi:hypothetical protein
MKLLEMFFLVLIYILLSLINPKKNISRLPLLCFHGNQLLFKVTDIYGFRWKKQSK